MASSSSCIMVSILHLACPPRPWPWRFLCSLPACPPPPPCRLGVENDHIRRRQVAGHLLSLLAFAAIPAPARGLDSPERVLEYQLYSDEMDKYSLLIPPDWTRGKGKATAERNVTAFFPNNDTSTNVNVVITGLGADYTSLGSFGTADSFAENLVNSLDRSWKKPPGQAAKLITSESKNGFYYVEYTVQRPGEKKRCLLSVVGIRFNGWYNRLYTVTGQFWEEDRDKYRTVLEKVVDSFKFV